MINNLLGAIFNKLLNIKYFAISLLLFASAYGYATNDFEKAGKIIQWPIMKVAEWRAEKVKKTISIFSEAIQYGIKKSNEKNLERLK